MPLAITDERITFDRLPLKHSILASGSITLIPQLYNTLAAVDIDGKIILFRVERKRNTVSEMVKSLAAYKGEREGVVLWPRTEPDEAGLAFSTTAFTDDFLEEAAASFEYGSFMGFEDALPASDSETWKSLSDDERLAACFRTPEVQRELENLAYDALRVLGYFSIRDDTPTGSAAAMAANLVYWELTRRMQLETDWRKELCALLIDQSNWWGLRPSPLYENAVMAIRTIAKQLETA